MEQIITQILENYSAPVIVGICLCIGYILKNVVSTDKINKFIPLILGSLGVGVECWITGGINPESLLTGLVSGLAATGCHQVFKNLVEKLNNKKTEKVEE